MDQLKEILSEEKVTQQNIADHFDMPQPSVARKFRNQTWTLSEFQEIVKYCGLSDDQIIRAVRNRKEGKQDSREIRMLKKIMAAIEDK